MKSIWKFELFTTDVQSVKMPLDAEILTVQMQNEMPYLWCLVDVEKEKAFREIRIIGTGYNIGKDFTGKYIGTYQVHEGAGVFHVFDYGYE